MSCPGRWLVRPKACRLQEETNPRQDCDPRHPVDVTGSEQVKHKFTGSAIKAELCSFYEGQDRQAVRPTDYKANYTGLGNDVRALWSTFMIINQLKELQEPVRDGRSVAPQITEPSVLQRAA
ncbi:hypothetical protein PsorP6_007332 [Peronosclerospora sorghi]|uniref:Uncharacterized protein n=1 Tax=Peronosclerospora sorghi TaxID=230839 RepID=A0ACC0W6D5_9STRA|nr:hypothetical protein PsorP6_007332 [Peronosclerospora sorghi]